MKAIDLIRPVYNHLVRPYLPRSAIVYNGVPVEDGRLFDLTVHIPDYKQASVRNLREHVRSDDYTVVIGGGRGVTAVVAWRQGDTVTVYEAAGEMLGVIDRTLELNQAGLGITTVHKPVGQVIERWGDDIPGSLHPSDLPDCDVLEMDCEGAEGDILAGMDIRPRVVIVEVHPQFGTDEGTVRAWFDREGYTVTDRYEHDNGPNVTLTGVRDDHA